MLLTARLFLTTLFIAYANGANDDFGLANGTADRSVLGGILAFWLLTLPVAATTGASVYTLVHLLAFS